MPMPALHCLMRERNRGDRIKSSGDIKVTIRFCPMLMTKELERGREREGK